MWGLKLLVCEALSTDFFRLPWCRVEKFDNKNGTFVTLEVFLPEDTVLHIAADTPKCKLFDVRLQQTHIESPFQVPYEALNY